MTGADDGRQGMGAEDRGKRAARTQEAGMAEVTRGRNGLGATKGVSERRAGRAPHDAGSSTQDRICLEQHPPPPNDRLKEALGACAPTGQKSMAFNRHERESLHAAPGALPEQRSQCDRPSATVPVQRRPFQSTARAIAPPVHRGFS